MRFFLTAILTSVLLVSTMPALAALEDPTPERPPWQVLTEQEGAVSILGHSPGLTHTPGWEFGFLSLQSLKGRGGEGGFTGLFAGRMGRLGFGVAGGLHRPSTSGPDGGDLSGTGDLSTRQLNAGAALRLNSALSVGARWEQLADSSRPDLDGYESWSTGLTLEPARNFSLAVSVDRLNTPRLEGTRFSPVLSAALGFRPGTERVGFGLEGARELRDSGDWRVAGSLRLMPLQGLTLGGYGRLVSREGDNDVVQWGAFIALSQGNIGAETSLDLIDPTDGEGESSMANRALFRLTGKPGTRLVARSRAIVRLNVDGPFPEAPRPGLLSRGAIPFGTWLERLNLLAEDPNVDGVLLDIQRAPRWGQGWEIRQAILRLRAAGKPVFARLAWADMRGMYLASAADHILLHPSGGVNTPGLALTSTYLAGLLERIGIGAQFIRFEAYKTAPEPLLQTGPSDESREQTRELLETFQRIWQEAVATGRRLEADTLGGTFHSAPHSVAAAHKAGLVDRVVPDDQLQAAMSELLGDEVRLLKRYTPTPQAWRAWSGGADVAVIPIEGTIVNGKGGGKSPLSGTTTGDQAIVRDLKRAVKDGAVAGIVVRVSSPGGAVLASDRLHRAVTQAAEKKPLVVSFGDTAASGGYYLACGAPHVMATPLTVTGSIGVFTGKVHLEALYTKIGASTSTERTHDHADANGSHRPWTDAEIESQRALIRSYYDRFVQLVADGRGLSTEGARERAQGRVYSGDRALALGLVDGHGSLWDAVQLVRQQAGLPDNAPLRIRYPKRRPKLTVGGLVGTVAEGAVTSALLSGPWSYWFASLEILAGGQALAQMPAQVEIR